MSFRHREVVFVLSRLDEVQQEVRRLQGKQALFACQMFEQQFAGKHIYSYGKESLARARTINILITQKKKHTLQHHDEGVGLENRSASGGKYLPSHSGAHKMSTEVIRE